MIFDAVKSKHPSFVFGKKLNVTKPEIQFIALGRSAESIVLCCCEIKQITVIGIHFHRCIHLEQSTLATLAEGDKPQRRRGKQQISFGTYRRKIQKIVRIQKRAKSDK